MHIRMCEIPNCTMHISGGFSENIEKNTFGIISRQGEYKQK
jgi:hypothetical protein